LRETEKEDTGDKEIRLQNTVAFLRRYIIHAAEENTISSNMWLHSLTHSPTLSLSLSLPKK
jgi:hypothetical protein